MTIRVLLADDEELVRFGLRTVLESAGDIEVVGEAADGAAAVAVTLDYRPAELAVAVVNRRPTRPAAALPSGGHGLVGLRERVRAAGGDLRAEPRLDGGFAVEAVLPA